MSTAIKPISFEDYLAQNEVADLPNARHEFVDGEWIELPSGSEQNDFLARSLLFALADRPVAAISEKLCPLLRSAVRSLILHHSNTPTTARADGESQVSTFVARGVSVMF